MHAKEFLFRDAIGCWASEAHEVHSRVKDLNGSYTLNDIYDTEEKYTLFLWQLNKPLLVLNLLQITLNSNFPILHLRF